MISHRNEVEVNALAVFKHFTEAQPERPTHHCLIVGNRPALTVNDSHLTILLSSLAIRGSECRRKIDPSVAPSHQGSASAVAWRLRTRDALRGVWLGTEVCYRRQPAECSL